VVDDVGERARADADRDGDNPNKRPNQSESLSNEACRASPSRVDRSDCRAGKEHRANHGFGNASLTMLVTLDEQTSMDGSRRNERHRLQDHDEPNLPRHGTYLL